MKLYLVENDNGEQEYLEVSVWSFMKCMFLTHLLFIGVFYGIIFILAFIVGFIGFMA